MDKLEKHFIKTMVKEILEIESWALQYDNGDFDNRYDVKDFAEETYGDINHYINIMVDRCINKNIISQLVDLNLALYDRNIHLKSIFYYNYKKYRL